MSRAHVKEVDGDTPEDLPELPLSPHPNYVTPRGLALLQQRRRQVDAELAALPETAADLRQQQALLARERRWLNGRIATAQCIDRPAGTATRVSFGTVVTLLDEAGAECAYRIVGEDEADPESGRVSWTSPLATALLGAGVGDSVTWPRPAGDLDVEVIAIQFKPDPDSATDQAANQAANPAEDSATKPSSDQAARSTP